MDAPIDNDNSQNFIAYISTIQSVIDRVANNSAAIKTWCITLTTGILALALGNFTKTNVSLIALIPAGMFWVLDAYYLALERCFRTIYNDVVNKFNCGDLSRSELFIIKPSVTFKLVLKACVSWSVFIFYLALIVIIVSVKILAR